MAPTDKEPGAPGPKKPVRRPRAKKPTPAADAGTGNGHNGWVDYGAETTSWDPWDEDDSSAGDRGLDRTLGEWLQAVVPPEAQVHFFNAGREFAAGIQATVEHHLNRGDEDDGGGAQALRIEIE